MGKSKGSSTVGCFTLIVIGGVIYLWSINPAAGIAALVAGIVLLFASCWPKSCQICGNEIKRGAYTWQIEGKRKRVCPKCNQTMERRQSKQATDKLFGK